MESNRILKSAGKVGILTFVSRVFGYGRDVTLAIILGAGFSMDAFAIAFRLANLLRRLFGEGAMTAAFVPAFAEYRSEHSSRELWRFAGKFFYTLGLILVGVVTLQIAFAPTIVGILAPGFMKVAGKWELTVFLNRLMAPYMLFIGLSAVLMSILQSMRSFTITAAHPIFFNLMVIFCAFTLSKFFDDPAIGIAIGVVFGGVLQMLVQVPTAWKHGMRFVPSISFQDPAIRRIALLMIPGIFGVGIVQINLLVDSLMASLLHEGSVASLYYANRVQELVLGIFTVSLATVILPEMSSQAAKRDSREMKATLTFSLRMVAFITIPASIGLVILAKPITQVLFQHGRFGAGDTERTAVALVFYSIGMLFVAGIRIMAPAFYAVKDTKTPVQCAWVALVINIIGNWILMQPLKQGGIALATSIAAFVNFTQLLLLYQKRFGPLDWGALKDSLTRIAVQSLAMALSITVFLRLFRFTERESVWGEAGVLFGTIGFGVLIYIGVALLLKSVELADLRRMALPNIQSGENE